MPTDQSTDSATATDRRTFLTRTAIGGALVSAGAVASPLGSLLGAAGAQDSEALSADDLLTDAAFAEFAAPLELAAVVAYQTALSGDALDDAWSEHARTFQGHHQEVADLLGTLVGEDADEPVADGDLVDQAESTLAGAADQDAVLLVLADIENTLSATHLSAIGLLRDPVTAKTVGQVLLTEAQQATFLSLGAGTAVAELTPAIADTEGALALPEDDDADSTTTTAAN